MAQGGSYEVGRAGRAVALQRLSLATVAADARRCLRRLPGLRAQATRERCGCRCPSGMSARAVRLEIWSDWLRCDDLPQRLVPAECDLLV